MLAVSVLTRLIHKDCEFKSILGSISKQTHKKVNKYYLNSMTLIFLRSHYDSISSHVHYGYFVTVSSTKTRRCVKTLPYSLCKVLPFNILCVCRVEESGFAFPQESEINTTYCTEQETCKYCLLCVKEPSRWGRKEEEPLLSLECIEDINVRPIIFDFWRA